MALRLAAASLLTALVLGQQPATADPVERQRAAVLAAEAAHGQDTLEVAAQLVKLGQLLAARGTYADALPVHRRALAIREANLPPDHPHLDVARVNVAAALVALDDPATAVPLLRGVCAARSSRPPSRLLAGALTNLGVAELKLGDYAAGAADLVAAVQMFREHFPDHPYATTALQDLAQLRLNQGRVEEARQLLSQAVATIERSEPAGQRHAQALFGMGVALARAERLDEAIACFERCRAIDESTLPATHPQHRDLLYRLGWLATERGDLEGAKQLLERSLEPDDALPSTSQLRRLLILARALLHRGEPDAARGRLAAAERIARALDVPPPQCVDLGFARAELAEADGDLQRAVAAWRELLAAIDDVDPETAFAARSSLAQALYRAGEHAAAARELVANLRGFTATSARVLPALFERERLRYVERNRRDLDLLLECLTAHPEALDAVEAYAAVASWKGQVARGVHECLGRAHDDADDVARLRRLREIADEEARGAADPRLRSERQRLLAAMAANRETPPPAPAPHAIQAALGDGEALLDYVLWRRRDGSQRLLAFVVDARRVLARDLGAAAAVERAAAHHLLLTSRSVERGAAVLAQEGGRQARAALFDPVADAVATCHTLHVCPDGFVAMLPFETLPDVADGSYLLERYTIDYLQGAAQLTGGRRPPAAETIVAFGAVDYGTVVGVGEAEPRGSPRPFAPLPQTEVEIAAIASTAAAAGQVPCRLVRGQEATEARLRELAAAATVLHLATHGFFGGASAGDGGVALAGVNGTAAGGDGVLTSGEAMLLDLRACRLVVLSACQSGLGVPFAGESLLGLRRSLHLAGAGCTVTSLWAVGDRATAELMHDFYQRLLQRGEPPGTALHKAKLAALARARAACGEGLPGRWGGFVCEGS